MILHREVFNQTSRAVGEAYHPRATPESVLVLVFGPFLAAAEYGASSVGMHVAGVVEIEQRAAPVFLGSLEAGGELREVVGVDGGYQHGLLLYFQIHSVSEEKCSCKICSGRDHHGSSAVGVGGVRGVLDRFGVLRDSVAACSEVPDIECAFAAPDGQGQFHAGSDADFGDGPVILHRRRDQGLAAVGSEQEHFSGCVKAGAEGQVGVAYVL